MPMNGDVVTLSPDDGFDTGNIGEVLLYGHFALDSYAGNGGNARTMERSLPKGWEILLETGDNAGQFNAAVPTFQATAYRHKTDGSVVIAYRGTDDGGDGNTVGELLATSIPLGLGLHDEASIDALSQDYKRLSDVVGGGSVAYSTTSYLQDALGFLAAVLAAAPSSGPAITHEKVSFTGHSLGGIVAGFMSAVTSRPAMVFDAGPHDKIFESDTYFAADGSIVTVPSVASQLIPAEVTPDFSQITSYRIEGEVLGLAIDALTAPLARTALQNVRKGTADAKGDWAPILIVMTDGKPSDTAAFQDRAPEVNAAGFAHVIGCAADPKARREDLNLLCDTVVTLETMDGNIFQSFFKWVTELIAQGGRSVGSTIKDSLPPPPAEINVVL